jgi:VWFA-related protein
VTRTLRVFAAVVIAGGAHAQEPPPPSPGAVFRTEVTSVEVDVFVTDAQGNVVPGLTRDDIQVFEEGVRQEIATFTEVSLPVESGPPEGPAADVSTNESDPGRVYAIVLDEAQTETRRSTLVRAAARQFITRYMADGDRAAVVYTTDGARAAVLFTADKAQLQLAAARFTGRKVRSAVLERMAGIDHQRELPLTVPDPAEKNLYNRPGVEADPSDAVRAHNARASMAALESVSRALREVQGRRKSILFFSEGVDYDTLDVTGKVQKHAAEVLSSMERAVATATWNNVAFYPIDPRGMVGAAGADYIEAAAPPQDRSFGIDSQSLDRERRRAQDSLRVIAAETGGEAAVDTNDLDTAFERIVRANSHYYLLGYHPADFRADGAFRRIEVRVTRPGLTVVARKGYARPRAPTDEAPEEERPAPAVAADTSPELRELLESPWPRPGLPLAVAAAAFRVAGRTAAVAVTIEVPGRALAFRREDDRAVNEVELSLVVLDETGRVRGGDRVLARPRLTAQTLERVQGTGLRFVRRLELEPGRYQLRVAAREGEQGQRGSVVYDLQVPDFGGEALAMSGVLLTSRAAGRTLTPGADEVVSALLETPPTVARAFAASDVLSAYAEVYDALAPAHEVAVVTTVTDGDGREAFRASGQRGSAELQAAGGGWRHTVEIPLARLRAGAYRLRIEATPTIGERRVARELSFQVVPTAARALAPDLPPPPAPARPGGDPGDAARIGRLEAWLDAVERHELGKPDPPAAMVRSWGPAALLDLGTDLAVTVALIDNPGYPVLWRAVDPERPTKLERAPYSFDEARRLRALAAAVGDRCARDPALARAADARGNARRCANRLLKRGAMLHTDAAIQLGDAAAEPGPDDPSRVRFRFRDGRQLGREDNAGQWELVRALLANVAPDPTRDETVRLWYLAVSAFEQSLERHNRHADLGARMFPDDAAMRFFAGCLHETFASTRIQGLVRSMRLPSSVAHGVGSEAAELVKAEQHFRRAVEGDPSHTEARIRLGRVLHRRGRNEEAARELERAAAALSGSRSMAADEGLLAYYAEMFLGAASESLGRPEAARAAYARAAVLYPGAPSPFLALSRLALSRSDRAGALEAVREALRADGPDRDDPLWRYHSVQGRAADAWFARLRQSLAVEP